MFYLLMALYALSKFQDDYLKVFKLQRVAVTPIIKLERTTSVLIYKVYTKTLGIVLSFN